MLFARPTGADRTGPASLRYQVATTDKQRRDWGLEEISNLPVLSADEAISLLFADPGDPVFDDLDPDMTPISADEGGVDDLAEVRGAAGVGRRRRWRRCRRGRRHGRSRRGRLADLGSV